VKKVVVEIYTVELSLNENGNNNATLEEKLAFWVDWNHWYCEKTLKGETFR